MEEKIYQKCYIFCHLNIFENCVKSEKRDDVRVLGSINIYRMGRKRNTQKRPRKVNGK